MAFNFVIDRPFQIRDDTVARHGSLLQPPGADFRLLAKSPLRRLF